METCDHDFTLGENTSKLTLFGLLFTQVLKREKIIEMVFFLNYRQHKKRPKFWIYDNIKAYLKHFFFERLCLAWKVSKENIILIPFLGSVKSLIKGDHFWPFFLRFCVKKNAGTDPVNHLWPRTQTTCLPLWHFPIRPGILFDK